MFLFSRKIVLVIFALVMVHNVPAYAIDCDQSAPLVQVKMLKKKTKTHRNFSIGNLTQLHTGAYRPGTSFVLGLGGGNYTLDAKMNFSVKQQGSVSCVRLDHLLGSFTIEPIMLIARDYRKGTCEYNAVLHHEKKHVAALMKFQQKYARKFKARLNNIVRNMNTMQVVAGNQTDIAQNQITEQINREIEAYAEQITPIIQGWQQEVDSPEEYRRVYAQCEGWE